MDAPLPLLFLVGDTGGGHRSAARAVSQALDQGWTGAFQPVICDPVAGPDCPRLQRWIVRLYGPCIRLTPWLWGFFWRITHSPRAVRWLYATLFAPVARVTAAAAAGGAPAAIVAFHPMTIRPALAARDRHAPWVPVVTVVTDLVTAHWAWRDAGADLVIVPSAAVAGHCRQGRPGGGWCIEAGLPVGAGFTAGPPAPAERLVLRRSLGLPGERFTVVMTGGAEGSGRIYRRAAAVLRHCPDVHVVTICGRNRLLRRRLTRLARRSGGRLTVQGFVANMADWLRSADLVVSKAGPGTIAEALCCGTPLILTSHVPGQEEGNAEFVTAAGAGRRAATARQLAVEVGRLHGDPAAIAAMRAAAARLSRPAAAADIAALLAGLAAGTPAEPAQEAMLPLGAEVSHSGSGARLPKWR